MNSSGMFISSIPTNFSDISSGNNKIESIIHGKYSLFIIFITIINIVYLWFNRYKVIKLYDLFHDHIFFIPSLIFIIIWIFLLFIMEGYPIFQRNHPVLKLLKKSTNAGLFALVIALFAYIDIVIPVFWTVLLIHFIFNDPDLD
tara:strand:+ start:79 stop:510 length:432 start_codon:yes stop_codon:yes gene_type:complete